MLKKSSEACMDDLDLEDGAPLWARVYFAVFLVRES